MEKWTWEENSVLYDVSKYTPPWDIFQAVCNEIGRYYTMKGAKYTKSSKRLKWTGGKLRCEIGFRSSHSNIAGDWVNLEIITSIYTIDTKDMERKGILNLEIRPKNFNVYEIDYELFFEIIKYIDEMLELVWSLETKEGLSDYLAGKSEEKLAYIKRDSNNVVYLGALLDG